MKKLRTVQYRGRASMLWGAKMLDSDDITRDCLLDDLERALLVDLASMRYIIVGRPKHLELG